MYDINKPIEKKNWRQTAMEVRNWSSKELHETIEYFAIGEAMTAASTFLAAI